MAAKTGSPTKYSKSILKKVDKYLEQTIDDDYVFTKSDGPKSTSWEEKVRVNLPTHEGFAKYIGVTKRTLYNWKERHEEFELALEKINDEQKQRLINRGLSGAYNSTIAKLVLSANHGMKERVDATSDDEKIENTFTDEQAERIANRLAGRQSGDDSA